MTTNQIRYHELQELKRSNLARELENNRSNIARELETNRSNVAQEQQTAPLREAQTNQARSQANLNASKLSREISDFWQSIFDNALGVDRFAKVFQKLK